MVYARYNELVKKLKRKKIVTAANPLPMEVCEILSEYSVNKENELTQPLNIFKYIEKVLYSDYRSNLEEYNKFYIDLKTLY